MKSSTPSKSTTNKTLLAVGSFLLLILIGVLIVTFSDSGVERTTNETSTLPDQKPSKPQEQTPQYSIDDPKSIWVVVNKTRPIPSSYEPADLTAPDVELRQAASEPNMQLRQQAAKQLQKLFAAASAQGHNLIVGSAYRSYSTQSSTYNSYVQSLGAEEANKISAKPGTSEHQTGWAVDVAGASWSCYLETCFGSTPEGKWIAANAHRFGFIVRYPKGKTAITGYNYEPWHLRYVGEFLATELNSTDQVMEEYFNL